MVGLHERNGEMNEIKREWYCETPDRQFDRLVIDHACDHGVIAAGKFCPSNAVGQPVY